MAIRPHHKGKLTYNNIIMKDIFISYSKNFDIVHAFLKDFEANGITTWIDIENLYKKPSEDFGEEIKLNIQNSSAFLLIYTKESIQSEYVKQELEYAFSLKKQILCFPYFPNCEELNYNKHRSFSEHLNEIQWLCNSQQIWRIPGLQEYIEGNERFRDLQSLISELPAEDNNKLAVDIILARIGIQICLKKPLTPFGSFTPLECNTDVYDNEDIHFNILNKSFYVTPTEKSALRIKSFLDKSEKWRQQLAQYNQGYEIENKEIYTQMIDFICEQCNISQQDAEAIVEQAREQAVNIIEKDLEVNTLMFNGPMVGIHNLRPSRTPGDENSTLDIDLYQSDYYTFKFTGELYHLLKKQGVQFNIKLGNISKFAPFLCSLGLGGFLIIKHGNEEYLQWVKRSSLIQAKNMWHFSYDETVHLLKDLRLDANGNPLRDSKKNMQLDPKILFNRALNEELRLQNKIAPHFKKGIFEIGLIECDRLEIELLSYAIIETDPTLSINDQLKVYTDSAKDKIEREKIDYILFTKEDIIKELQGKFITPEALMLAEHLLLQKEEHKL